MSEQYYRLEETWWSEDWPFDIGASDLRRLNKVSPPGYTYALQEVDDGTMIALYEYTDEVNDS